MLSDITIATLATLDGERDISDAVRVGKHFAIHQDWNERIGFVSRVVRGPGWTVTHVPSGYAIRRALPTFAAAARAARAAAVIPVDWASSDWRALKRAVLRSPHRCARVIGVRQTVVSLWRAHRKEPRHAQ